MSTINLQKGGKVLLEKANESGSKLTVIKVGLGWDQKDSSDTGAEFDLDASIFCVGKDGKSSQPEFLYYGSPKVDNKPTILNGALQHSGDNLTGEGEGDDETISIDLTKIPEDVEKMVVVVTIHDATSRGQNFGMAESSYVRLLNASDNDTELVHFDLNFDSSMSTGVKFAEIFRKGDEWAFSAVQKEFEGGLATTCTEYGIPV